MHALSATYRGRRPIEEEERQALLDKVDLPVHKAFDHFVENRYIHEEAYKWEHLGKLGDNVYFLDLSGTTVYKMKQKKKLKEWKEKCIKNLRKNISKA